MNSLLKDHDALGAIEKTFLKALLQSIILVGTIIWSFDVCLSIHLSMYWRLIFGCTGLFLIGTSYSLLRNYRFTLPSILAGIILFSAIVFSAIIYSNEPASVIEIAKSPSDYTPFCPVLPPGQTRKPLTEESFSMSGEQTLLYRTNKVGNGNRLNGMISALALALVTNRTLLIDWTTYDLQKTELEEILSVNTKIARIVHNTTDPCDLKFGYCLPCVYRPKRVSYHDFFNKNSAALRKQKHVVLESTQFFLPMLYARSEWRSKLCEYFTLNDAFKTLSSLLYQPPKSLEAPLKEALSRFEGKTPIGLQIRVRDRYFIEKARVDNFLRCAQVVAKDYENPVFFVASDSGKIRRHAAAAFSNLSIGIADIVKKYSLDSAQFALLDIFVLAKSQQLILTPYSTFGAIVAGMSGVTPFYIERKHGTCMKDIFSTPKFQYYHGMASLGISNFMSSDTVNQYDSYM